jgi:hypothetical protein
MKACGRRRSGSVGQCSGTFGRRWRGRGVAWGVLELRPGSAWAREGRKVESHSGPDTAATRMLGKLVEGPRQSLKNSIGRSGSVVGVTWCRLEYGGGVKWLGMGCPRRCRARPELGEKSNAECGWRVKEMPQQNGKWDVEVLVVLVRVKGKGFKACSGVLHGGGVVATDGRSGYRGVCTGRHRGGASAVGRPSGDA